ncbi:DinB family protein [Singulisphaera sp. Ch08]|uniref:DinB family protein n=1 Tax=Singulisphaera sp. Ch08 TaxID=3120278 RepID=A0AAU7C980_9BACT
MPNLDPDGILEDIRRGYDGDAWHGPPLRKLLDGVTAEVACSHPVPEAHSIWEIVAHLAAWDGVVVDRITKRRAIETPEQGNFPPVTKFGPEAWAESLQEMDRQHARLIEAVSTLDEATLNETVAGKNYSTAHMIRGVAQHMSYHAGQIALLKKLAEAKDDTAS